MSDREERSAHRDARSPTHSLSDHSTNGDRKAGIGISYRSRSKDRSRSRSPSVHKSKRKYSRSKSRSRSSERSYRRRSKYRSRSRSSRKYRHGSRSYSRSPSYSSQQYRRRGRGRTHSRSPMSNRRRHNGSRDNPKPNRCLGIFGLNISTTEGQIYDIFSMFGPVEKVQVIIDAKTGHSRGFCFIYFKNYEDARVAKEECSGMLLDGKEIRVDFSITNRAHTPTPGIYMGKPTYSDRRHGRDRGDRDWGDSFYRGSRGSWRNRSPSPYYSSRSRRRYDRSRSRSYSPH